MATYHITAPDGSVYEVTGNGSEQDALAQVQAAHQAPAPAPASPPADPQGRMAPLEAAANVGSSMVATPAAGLAGLFQGAMNMIPGHEGMPAADRVQQVQQAMTYQPRTEMGQKMTDAVQYPFAKLAQFGDYAGQKAADVTDSPAIGAGVNTAIQFLPASLLKLRGARDVGAAQSPKPRVQPAMGSMGNTPVEPANVVRAKDYVANRTSLDWNSLSDAVKTRISDVAKDGTTLDKLDPAALERQARLESLPVPVPATRGQLTRDPVQLRNEGNVSATTSGKPIRDIHVAANKALVQNLEVLKGRTRGTADSPEQVGASMQDAARAKLDLQKKSVSGLYKQAESAGELQGTASTRPLIDLIEGSPDKTHLGWVESWLGKMDVAKRETGPAIKGMRLKLSLKELEDLRQGAVARAMDGGTEGYYAGKVIAAIDSATDGAGGTAYKAARAARKSQAMEFEEQGGVAKLVENKTRTDRAVALEDTWRKTVLGGSIQDLTAVKRSLMTGGDAQTRTAGRKAWADLRAQTIQHITDEATKSVTRFEDGTPNVTPAAMERAIKSIGAPKLEAIFGPGTVRRLRQIMEATRDVKTEPPPGFKGSPTWANAIAFLEKGIGKVPVVGDTVTGAIRGAVKLREMGQAGREVRQATSTPLDDAQRAAAKAPAKQRSRNALRDAYPAASSTQGNALRKDR